MADPAPGKEGFHPLSARETGKELPEVLPLHQPAVTIAPRTPMMEEPRNSPIMPVLTLQPQDGISTQNPPPETENFPPQTGNFTLNYCVDGSVWYFEFPKVEQTHTSGEVGILGTVLLRVYSGTTFAIFIEIGLYLTDKEQKISWHSFFETRCSCDICLNDTLHNRNISLFTYKLLVADDDN